MRWLCTILLAASITPTLRAAERTVTVTLASPGASAAEVDQAVAAPLNHALASLPGVQRLETESVDGRCEAVAVFNAAGDGVELMAAVQQKLNDTVKALPPSCLAPQLRRGDLQALPGWWAAVTHEPTVTGVYEPLERSLAQDITMIPGVHRAAVLTGRSARPAIVLNPAQLAANDVTLEDVRAAVAAAYPPDGAAARAIVVRQRNGVDVHLADVAEIGHETIGIAALNGQPAALVAVSAEPNVNAAQLDDALKQTALHARPGMRFTKAADLRAHRMTLVELHFPMGTALPQRVQAVDKLIESIRRDKAAALVLAYQPDESDYPRLLVAGADAASVRRRLSRIENASPRVCEVGGDAGLVAFPVRIALVGLDRDALHRWATAVTARLAAENVVADPATEGDATIERTVAQVDRDTAAKLGLSIGAVRGAADLASGRASDEGHFTLCLRSLRPHEGLRLRNAAGELVPLSAIARMTTQLEPMSLRTFGSFPAIRITAAPLEGKTIAQSAVACLHIADEEKDRLKITHDFKAVAESP